MPEEIEVDTDKLNEQIREAHDEHAQESGAVWLRYVGLGAAIFAVVAAVAALRAGDLINEATIAQLKASDTWAEYQAVRQKEHIYTVAADDLADRPTKNLARLHAYRSEIAKEAAKEKPLETTARKLEADSAEGVNRHRFFGAAVALFQVAIALGAVGALARYRPAWYVSLVAGIVGFGFFLKGFM
jgi:hypothetical protein